MKIINLLYIGVLSIVLMASSSSFARRTSPQRSIDPARSIKNFESFKLETKIHIQGIVDRIATSNRPDYFNSGPKELLEVYEVYLRDYFQRESEVSSETVSSAVETLLIRASEVATTRPQEGAVVPLQVQSTRAIDGMTAQAIIGFLKGRMDLQLSEAKEGELMSVITSATKINTADGMKRLARKVLEDTNNEIRSEDVQKVVQFAINTARLQRSEESAANPEAQNIILDLAQHSYDMVTWPVATRRDAMDLIGRVNNHFERSRSVEDALRQSLTERGYEDVSARAHRRQVIKRHCR